MDTGYEQMEEERKDNLIKTQQAEIGKLKKDVKDCMEDYADLVVTSQAEIDEALKIIHRFAYFDIFKDRSDALNMVAKRFLNKHDYKGE